MNGKATDHWDLSAYGNWAEVLQAVEGSEHDTEAIDGYLAITEKYGLRSVLTALQQVVSTEEAADVVITTAHRSKGLEWSSAALSADLSLAIDEDGYPLREEQARLLYVALTRAQRHLGMTAIEHHAQWDEAA